MPFRQGRERCARAHLVRTAEMTGAEPGGARVAASPPATRARPRPPVVGRAPTGRPRRRAPSRQPDPSSAAAPVAVLPASGLGQGGSPPPPSGGSPAPVIALIGVLLLGGSGLAMTLRNRPRPAMAQ